MAGRTLIVIGDAVRPPDPDAPRRDYHELAALLRADILDPSAVGARGGRFRTGVAMARAAAGRADAYDSIYCDSEHIAMPLAWLLAGRAKRPRLTFIAHYLTPLKKRLLCRTLRVRRAIDCVALHSPAQVARAIQCGFSEDQIRQMPYQVDARYWQPIGAAQEHVISVGQEFRDFPTLIEAVRGVEVRVEIAAGSFWSSRDIGINDDHLPANVRAGRRPYAELRDLYAHSHFAVVPLHDVDFQAGIIAILEAMAMGKAVVVSRTRGQRGVISGQLMRDGALHDLGACAWPEATGIYVPPGDVASLRDAIQYLLGHPDVAAAMGAAGRRHVEAEFTIERFAERVAAMVRGEAGAVPGVAR